MDEITVEDLASIPAYRQVRAFARALRAASIDHEVIGDYEKVEITDDLEDIMENPEFISVYTKALREAFIDDLLEGLREKGLLEAKGVDPDGSTIYGLTENVA